MGLDRNRSKYPGKQMFCHSIFIDNVPHIPQGNEWENKGDPALSQRIGVCSVSVPFATNRFPTSLRQKAPLVSSCLAFWTQIAFAKIAKMDPTSPLPLPAILILVGERYLSTRLACCPTPRSRWRHVSAALCTMPSPGHVLMSEIRLSHCRHPVRLGKPAAWDGRQPADHRYQCCCMRLAVAGDGYPVTPHRL